MNFPPPSKKCFNRSCQYLLWRFFERAWTNNWLGVVPVLVLLHSIMKWLNNLFKLYYSENKAILAISEWPSQQASFILVYCLFRKWCLNLATNNLILCTQKSFPLTFVSLQYMFIELQFREQITLSLCVKTGFRLCLFRVCFIKINGIQWSKFRIRLLVYHLNLWQK